ncbi:MAG: transglutaminase domain-containing protein [Deltaproteobacteria bacterium]|nr:transglutaminase domain-containing protein [Deltaproteobacteria bacterium]
MRRVLALAVVASWVVLIATLVRKHAAPDPTAVTPPPLTDLAARDEWFGLYKDGRKIGWAHRAVARRDTGYVFTEESRITLAMLGTRQSLESTLRAETDPAFALRTFGYTLVTPAATFTASGTSDDRTLRARYGPQGRETDLVLPLSEPIALPSTLRPRVLADRPEPGARYRVPVFNPLTARAEPMVVMVEARERLATRAGVVETLRLAEEHQSVKTRAWIDGDGNVVREEALLGFTLEREPRDTALAAPDEAAPLDLVAASAIPLDGAIADPRSAMRLTLRVRGAGAAAIPSDPPRQRWAADLLTITREPLPDARPRLGDVPADLGHEVLAAGPFVEADDPAIRAAAADALGDAADARTAAERLLHWVHAAIEKTPSVTVPSAREVLASRRGDCNEHAVLLAALARAAGIPARVVAGAVYANDGFYYHAWNELWVGAWVSADAVFDQLPADATHVKLIEGGLERQMTLMNVIGRLAFVVVEETPE